MSLSGFMSGGDSCFCWLLIVDVGFCSSLLSVCVSHLVAPMISITEAGRDTAENGRDPHLEMHSDSKVCVCVVTL